MRSRLEYSLPSLELPGRAYNPKRARTCPAARFRPERHMSREDDWVCICTGGEAEPSGESGPRGSRMNLFRIGPIFAVMLALLAISRQPGLTAASKESHLLYVASPGIRYYVEYGGVGVLVYDIDAGHRWVKRIPMP